MENHAKYGDSIYFHSPDDSTLWVNLFIPSELNWNQKGLSLRQETTFPIEQGTALILKTKHPVKLAIKLRIPYWAGSGVALKINGQAQDINAEPQSYLTLDREWQDGDRIELSLAMSLHLHRASDLPDSVAILYGPLVLAAELGTEGMPPSDQARDQKQYNKIPSPPVPVLVSDSDDPQAWLKPVEGKPLEFSTAGVGKPREMNLIPLYEVHHERYTVYWKLLNEHQWESSTTQQSGPAQSPPAH